MKRTAKEIEQLLQTIDDAQHPLFQEFMNDERVSVQKLIARWHKRKQAAEKRTSSLGKDVTA